MNGLLAARRICREKSERSHTLYAEALLIRTCTSLVLASPQASRREETSPNPWFLARIMLPLPTAQRRYVNQGPFRTRRTPNRPLLERSSADSKRCDILLAEPLKAPNGGLLWSNISITFKKTLCIAVQFYPGLLLEALRHSCRRQLNLLPIPIIPCPPKD